MANDGDDGDYEIGYGKPPKQHRFKKGQSGNPKGRPKRSKNIGSIISEIADETVEANLKGKRRKISLREAIIRRLMADAMKGDLRALRLALDLINQHDPVEHRQYVIEAPAPMDLEEWQRRFTPGYALQHPVNPVPGAPGGNGLEPPAPPTLDELYGGKKPPGGSG
jgi:hypothetical protein